MTRKVAFPALVDKITTLRDGSVKVCLETREFNPDDSAILFSLRNHEGWFLFSENEIQEDDIPDRPARSGKDVKSKSEVLRGVIWHRWDQLGRHGDFDVFYASVMNRIIDIEKEKLDNNK